MKLVVANVVLASIFALMAAKHASAADVAVLMSSDASVYQEALEGFRETTGHRIVSVQTLKDNPASWREDLKKLRSTIEPDLIFVIGTSALQAVAGEIASIPIVHAMVFNPFVIPNSSAKNITGISMIPSLNQSIGLFKEWSPKFRRIGVIYDPLRGSQLFLQARTVAQKESLQLVAGEVRAPGEIALALKSLEKQIDALWLWPDEAYLSDEILQRIFLFSFDRKIPVFGLSERHTQMGAVIALFHGSAKDMGRQAAEAVNKVPGDPRATQMPIVVPRQTKLTVNLRTARKLDVDIPDSIIGRADNAVKAPIYREGDWWAFRIKTLYPGGRSEVEEHRVTFKAGKFESEHPGFLTGGDLAGTPSFLPFASVFLDDPTRKWLDFPLLPGKLWRFSYPSASYIRSRRRWTLAVAEVLGPASKTIETTAGSFDAIEIIRHDQLNPAAFSTYFYSPQTKSVVKLKAVVDLTDPRSSGRQFELELLAYGTERKDLR